jgi:hypothetical protein
MMTPMPVDPHLAGLIHGLLDMTFSPAADAAVAESVDRFAKLLHR